MIKNMGTPDRFIRVVLALLFGGLILAGEVTGTLAIILGILGVVFLATSVVSFCPLYLPFKISTCKVQDSVRK